MKSITIIALLLCAITPYMSDAQTRTSILEISSGSGFGFVTDSRVVADTVQANHPNLIILETHGGDGMSFPDGQTVLSDFGMAFPSGLIDRYKFSTETNVPVPRNVWEALVTEREAIPTEVNVSITNQSWNEVTREIGVTVQADFLMTTTGDMRLNLFIVEDSVTGFGAGYDQANYYDGLPSHPFYGAGDPIVGYVHRNVERAFIGGTWGSAGIIPASVTGGSTYSTSYAYTLPIGYDETQIKLVPVVQRYDGSIDAREIMNAGIVPLDLTCFIPLSLTTDACESYTSPSGNYTWTSSGMYEDTIQGATGCDTIVTIDLTVNTNTSSTLTETALDIFTLNGQTYTASGVYTQTIPNSAGCDSTITLDLALQFTGIDEITDGLELMISPNPSNGEFTIHTAESLIGTNFIVLDPLGRVVYESTLKEQESTIQLLGMAKGFYLMKVFSDRTKTVRLVIN
ncbi:Omp28-related outer membrane protein [Crocinitomicaceae bacterium]|nr:Omp28-related outer membrane protein [Crocinitomicaceae bacterium]MDC0257216.1 Omp28-related outer membrane protein [Crocinitomicaceae bacterium]